MKKIIGLMIFCLVVGITYGQGIYNSDFTTTKTTTNTNINTANTNTPKAGDITAAAVANQSNKDGKNILKDVANGKTTIPNNTTDTTPTTTDSTVMGITMGSKCLKNGQCSFKIYDLLGIRKSVETEGEDSTSPDIFVQDIILSATFFIGTVLTLVIIVAGIMFIMAGASGKDPSKAKSGIINGIIGLVIVICSYAIIRVVQYIAKGV